MAPIPLDAKTVTRPDGYSNHAQVGGQWGRMHRYFRRGVEPMAVDAHRRGSLSFPALADCDSVSKA